MAVIIKPKFEIEESQPVNVVEIKKMIEKAGRTCYRSENFTTEDSYERFVSMLENNGHGAMLEHGTVYLTIPDDKWVGSYGDYEGNAFSHVNHVEVSEGVIMHYVTTNYRVLFENSWLEDLEFISAPTEYHEKRYTVRFTIQLVIEREFNRHRSHSLGSESTRYVNYLLDKFGNSITICQPDHITDEDLQTVKCDDFWGYIEYLNTTREMSPIDWWWFSNLTSEMSYLKCVEGGWKPEQARTILPLDVKCESVHTAFKSDWIGFFKLRSYVKDTNKPHPDAIAIAKPLMDEFIEKGYIEEEEVL